MFAVLEGEFDHLENLISKEEKESNPTIQERLRRIMTLIEENLNLDEREYYGKANEDINR